MTDHVITRAAAHTGSAVVNALPAITLLLLYLWLAVGLVPFGFLMLGESGQFTAIAIFAILAIPGVWLSVRVVRLCIAAEREMLNLEF